MRFIKNLWSEPISNSYVRQLTINIVEHEKLSRNFPLYLKFVEVTKVRPLPLIESALEDSLENSLVSSELLNTYNRGKIEVKSKLVRGLSRRYSYNVKVHFYIMLQEDGESKKHEFYQSVSGSSSIITLIRKAINRLLLWDIECLNRYFPVAQELYGRENRYGSGDTVATIDSEVALRLVYRDELYKSVRDIKEGNNDDQAFNSYVDGDMAVWESFCGFDTIDCIANAEIYARLRAIQNSYVNPQTYLKQLYEKFLETIAFSKGKNCLYHYPFSLHAAQKFIERELLNKYRIKNEDSSGFVSTENYKNKAWSNIAYEAHLFITRGYIRQGQVERAKSYIDALKSHESYLTCLIAANYYFTKAELEYIRTDRESRTQINNECNKYLNLAKENLCDRALLFLKLNEFSQGSTAPFHSYLARVFALEARLIVYYPQFLTNNEDRREIIDAIAILQTARINAARDGNSYYYAQTTLFQSCCFLMNAYDNRVSDTKKTKFTTEQCFEWAVSLLDHALICFSEASEKAYQSYTDRLILENEISEIEDVNNSNGERDEFYYIERLLSITPFLSKRKKQNLGLENSSNSDNVIEIKAKYLRADVISPKLKEKMNEKRYQLFGQHAAYYWFTRAFYLICKREEKDDWVRKNIEDAYNLFLYSLGTALGCEKRESESSKYEITRDRNAMFKTMAKIEKSSTDNPFKIRGIYLYALREIEGFCKVFLALCEFILNPKIDKELVEEYFNNIHYDIEDRTNQYNLHMEKHFKLIKDVLISHKSVENQSTTEIRDSILPKFVRALRRIDDD